MQFFNINFGKMAFRSKFMGNIIQQILDLTTDGFELQFFSIVSRKITTCRLILFSLFHTLYWLLIPTFISLAIHLWTWRCFEMFAWSVEVYLADEIWYGSAKVLSMPADLIRIHRDSNYRKMVASSGVCSMQLKHSWWFPRVGLSTRFCNLLSLLRRKICFSW